MCVYIYIYIGVLALTNYINVKVMPPRQVYWRNSILNQACHFSPSLFLLPLSLSLSLFVFVLEQWPGYKHYLMDHMDLLVVFCLVVSEVTQACYDIQTVLLYKYSKLLG